MYIKPDKHVYCIRLFAFSKCWFMPNASAESHNVHFVFHYVIYDNDITGICFFLSQLALRTAWSTWAWRTAPFPIKTSRELIRRFSLLLNWDKMHRDSLVLEQSKLHLRLQMLPSASLCFC